MPWKIETRGDKHCVVRNDGKTEKCHVSRDLAVAHLRALYASEGDMEKGHNLADWLESRLHQQFTILADDLFGEGKLTRNERIELSSLIGTALGVFHEGLQKEELVELYRRGAWEKTKARSSFSITKQSDGRYRWFAIWTNKYRDEDNPPEILSEAAHLDFIKAVTDGEWPYPEAWLYHVPGSRFGVADLVAYDRSTGFSLAAGLVDDDKELVAEALNSTSVPLAVSHGMPPMEIRRDESDPTILTRYRSKEISPLPFTAAANKLTNWVILGENDMELEPKEAEKKLQSMFGAEWFDKLKGVLNLKSQKATEEELEYKEGEATDGDPTETQEAEEESDGETDEEVPETEDSEPPITRQEIADAIAEVSDALSTQFKSVLEPFSTQLSTLTATIAELKQTDEKKIAEKAAWTPGPSISEIVLASIIGKDEARVDGRTKEAKDGPKQAKDTLVYTGNPTLDDAITGIISGSAPFGGD